MSSDPLTDAWNKSYQDRPLNQLCERVIEIRIVGKRCIYINDYRVQGNKPYDSENITTEVRKTTVREVLEAFTEEEINAYLQEKIAIDAYCAGLRNYRDATLKDNKNEQ